VRKLNIALIAVLEIARVGVRRAAAFIALGFRTANDETERSVRLEANAQIHFMPDPLTEKQSRDVRSSFAQWIVGNGLRALHQSLAAFIDEIFPALLVMKAGGIVPADLALKIKPMQQDTNLGSKLQRLKEHIPTSPCHRPKSSSMFISALT
jgi:hypothetical protein